MKLAVIGIIFVLLGVAVFLFMRRRATKKKEEEAKAAAATAAAAAAAAAEEEEEEEEEEVAVPEGTPSKTTKSVQKTTKVKALPKAAPPRRAPKPAPRQTPRYRYVRITRDKQGNDHWMNLTEVEVFSGGKNVARGKTVTASSLFAPQFPHANLVDGNMTNFAHTHNTAVEYFQIDLGQDYEIEKVVIHNRSDCCQARLRNTKIQLAKSANMSSPMESRRITTQEAPNAVITWDVKTNKIVPKPAPKPAPKIVQGLSVSTNGRCGPRHGNTRCAGKSCCSPWGWCGGEQGKRSDWCTMTSKGAYNGKFDGR